MGPRSTILGLILMMPAAATAQETRPPDALLTELGLEAEKTRYVFLDAEKELHQKYRDAVAARDQAQQALAKIEGAAMMREEIFELQAGEERIQAQIAAARSSSSGMGGGRNRYSRYYRNQANAVVREGQRESQQLRNQIAQAKKQLPDEKHRQADESGARLAMDQARRAVTEVNDAYDALVDRYQEAREKPGVLKALEDAGRPKRFSYQLGPSEESSKIGKWAKGILKIHAKRPTATAREADAEPTTATGPKAPR
jgi:hypothetical protein